MDPTPPPSSSDDITLPPQSSGVPADSGPVAEAPGPDMTGRYFGDYELLEEIARGGMR